MNLSGNYVCCFEMLRGIFNNNNETLEMFSNSCYEDHENEITSACFIYIYIIIINIHK